MFGISWLRDDSAIAMLRKLTDKLWLVTVWDNISPSCRKHLFKIYTLPESALQKQKIRLQMSRKWSEFLVWETIRRSRFYDKLTYKLWLITVRGNISPTSRKHLFKIYTLPESALQKQNNRLHMSKNVRNFLSERRFSDVDLPENVVARTLTQQLFAYFRTVHRDRRTTL